MRFPAAIRPAVLAVSCAALLAGLAPRAGAGQEGPVPGPEAAAGRELPVDETSCFLCHADTELFDTADVEIVEDFRDGVHAAVGLSCHDCHGGNPDPELREDFVGAKDDEYAANPYRGVPDPPGLPGFCGSCHSDVTYMRRFDPNPRTDQVREYWTSQHGEALRAGDTNVATCTDCHGVHDIRRPGDPGSRVYPQNVAETCRGCHADAARMDGYTVDGERPLPVDQYAKWNRSVHATALLDREDLSAPTCNDCHGNHGAVPPGVESINFVCGQCHGREAELFRGSTKDTGFDLHNEYLREAGSEGCAACHFEPEPQAGLTDLHSLGECAACHGNHGIVRPTLAMLSPLPETPCAFCHEGPGALPVAASGTEPEEAQHNYVELRDELIERAEAAGRQGVERFNWLVERVPGLAPHTLPAGEEPSAGPRLRPEFQRLFEKFRIGRTYYEYEDPLSGETVREPVRRCASCHAGPDVLGEDAIGLEVAAEMLSHMNELTLHTAQAERTLLRARRGGVETREVLLEIDQAVDAQIELEVLLHTFSTASEGDFVAREAEGMEHAEAALAGAREALEELAFRRRGLAIALGIIVLVLVGLALQIRRLSRREAETATPSSGDPDEPGRPPR